MSGHPRGSHGQRDFMDHFSKDDALSSRDIDKLLESRPRSVVDGSHSDSWTANMDSDATHGFPKYFSHEPIMEFLDSEKPGHLTSREVFKASSLDKSFYLPGEHSKGYHGAARPPLSWDDIEFSSPENNPPREPDFPAGFGRSELEPLNDRNSGYLPYRMPNGRSEARPSHLTFSTEPDHLNSADGRFSSSGFFESTRRPQPSSEWCKPHQSPSTGLRSISGFPPLSNSMRPTERHPPASSSRRPRKKQDQELWDMPAVFPRSHLPPVDTSEARRDLIRTDYPEGSYALDAAPQYPFHATSLPRVSPRDNRFEPTALPHNLEYPGRHRSSDPQVSAPQVPRPTDASELFRSFPRPGSPPAGPSRYAKYVSLKTALEGLSSGIYQKGVLRVSAGRTDDAFISSTTPGAPDYMVQGRIDRNRSINGDTVVFEILDKSRWASVEDPYRAIEAVLRPSSAAPIAANKDRPTVKIVHVLEFGGKDRPYIGVLRANRMSQNKNAEDGPDEASLRVDSSDKFVRAVPIDKKIPWILVPTAYVEQWQEIPGMLQPSAAYRVQIDSWPESSSLPIGRVVDFAGQLGELDTEERVAMIDHHLENHMLPFSDAVEAEAMDIVESCRSELKAEVARRTDFRNLRTMTIDPLTARDLDDAIHVRVDDSVSPAEFEVGVHIADVSHFVRAGSLIDVEAKNRCTTVYLPRQTFPMLPRALCEHLCSLNPDEEKLVFSVVFKMKSDGTLSERSPPWFGKSVIKTCCRFNYDEVQNILNKFHRIDPNSDPSFLFDQMNNVKHPEISASHDWGKVWADLIILESLTQELRKRRFDNGSMQLHQARLQANFDLLFGGTAEVYAPDLDEEADDSEESSHHLIEELMLLANSLVAEKLVSSAVGESSVIRYHPQPEFEKVELLRGFLQSAGFDPDFSSSATTHQFLQSVRRQYGALTENAVAQLFMAKMKPADYGVSSLVSNTHHFALAFSLYTHFTSPIRRYADVMVHRVLTCAISGTPPVALKEAAINPIDLQAQCEECNEKRLEAKRASEECSAAFFCVWLKEHQQLYPTLATVLTLQDQSIMVYLPKLGTQKRIFYNNVKPGGKPQKPLKPGASENATILDSLPARVRAGIELPLLMQVQAPHVLEIVWTRQHNGETQKVKQVVRTLCPVPVYVVPLNKTPIEFAVVVIAPWQPAFGEAIVGSTLLDDKQKNQAKEVLDLGLQKGHIDLPGCRAPASNTQQSESSAHPSKSRPKPTGRKEAASPTVLDAGAAKRIVNFHTEGRSQDDKGKGPPKGRRPPK